MGSRIYHRINPYKDILRTIWENRDQAGYAWRILRDGVCDGCALGTSGLQDWTMSGTHLCWIRLNLLRLNTMPALNPKVLKNTAALQKADEKTLRQMGRISTPLLRQKGDEYFQPVSWEKACHLMVERINAISPEHLAFYLVSRGTVNETYYVAQKVARFLGTNHIDNSARVCHAPSTTALKQTIGYAATTCSYKDMIGTDLLVFFGSNPANNQPVVMKYLYLAKKQGTKIAMVNTFREPGMEKYWIPSVPTSALFGTRITDHFFQIQPGGDIAFINGVLKHLVANKWVDEAFIRQHTTHWHELAASLQEQSFEELEALSGASREAMLEFARIYARAKSAIFVWSMGITMHKFGIFNVKAIANLALSRGMVGKPHTGLMAIRGHSGVQGGAEMGAVPNQFPGGKPVNRENAAELTSHWGFPVPHTPGYFAAEMLDAAHQGKLDLLYSVGSNLFSILPDSAYVYEAIRRIPFRVHHDIVLNPQMFVPSDDTVLILPATTRYEMKGGNTETTTERRIIFNPEIPGPRIPLARDEWRVLLEIARQAKPELAQQMTFPSTAAIRDEIARIVPLYEGIQHLNQKGDFVQWGGERLAEGYRFATDDGKAHFAPLSPPPHTKPDGWFHLSTRRGKQFNSITFSEKDPLLENSRREEVFFSPADMQRLGLTDGTPVVLRNSTGKMNGVARQGKVTEGVVMVYWPEANVLIPRGVSDPVCGIPAYRDAVVEVKRLKNKD